MGTETEGGSTKLISTFLVKVVMLQSYYNFVLSFMNILI